MFIMSASSIWEREDKAEKFGDMNKSMNVETILPELKIPTLLWASYLTSLPTVSYFKMEIIIYLCYGMVTEIK